jgi:hypothetical protein
MSFFTSRKRADPGKSAEKRAEGKGKLVRSEFIPRRRLADNDLAGHVCSVTQQVAANSLREIDDLIVVLQLRREKLLDESARVQFEIIEYAKLSQSTMQSVRVITESERRVEEVSNEEHRNSGGEAPAQNSEGGQAGVTAVPASSDLRDLPEEASGPSIAYEDHRLG